jgi:hypothetical protein
LSEEKEPEQDPGGDARNKHPLAQSGPADVTTGSVQPILRRQLGGIDQVTEHMDRHGAEPQDEAGFV